MFSSKTHPNENPLLQVAEVELHYKHKVKPADRPYIKTSRQAYDAFMQVYNPMTIGHHESFYVMGISRSGKLLGVAKISDGGITGTVVDVRFIFQAAIKMNAVSFVLSHNHPSGNLDPSDADKRITRSLYDGGRILDIQLKDHIIVTPDDDRFYSFADNGLI
jgi:DNA repair protein RadC